MTRKEAAQLVEDLYDTWAPFLVRHAMQLTGDKSVAEDFTQEAFMAMYRCLRSGKEITNPRAWTLAVVRNLANKRVRSERRHPERLEPTEAFDLIESPPLADAPPDLADIHSLLPVLTPREVEVLTLRIGALKYREIAGALGISAKSVATLLARALNKLQDAARAKVEGEFVLSRKRKDDAKTL